MFLHTFRIVIRVLKRQKFYTFLNILGLSIGMVSCFLILTYVYDELTYDQFHKNYKNAFRINTFWGNDPSRSIYATTPPPLKEIIQQQIPEVEYVARVVKSGDITMRFPKVDGERFSEQVFRETNVYNVDQDFLKILDFNFIRGDILSALTQPEALVMTKKSAIRYFGKEKFDRNEIVGNKIETGGDGNLKVITGIVDPPENTHFHFDFLCSVDIKNSEIMRNDLWVWNIMHTYVKLRENAGLEANTIENVQRKLAFIAQEYCYPVLTKDPEVSGQFQVNKSDFTYKLQPVSDIHLHSTYLRELEANGNVLVVNALIIIALIILILALINFINLSIVQSFKRLKEVGVKKVLGSGKTGLVFQFLLESVILVILAMVLALGMAEVAKVPFNSLSGKNISFDWFTDPLFLPILIGIILFIGLTAGAYPAFLFSGYSPAKIFKGVFKNEKKESLSLRSSFVIFQFVISIGLIICTLIVKNQVNFIAEKDLGFEKENVLIIKNDMEIDDAWKEFKDYLKQNPSIRSVSFATNFPAGNNLPMRDFYVKESDLRNGINWVLVDDDYQQTLGMEMLEGRSFSGELASDKKGLILNEAAVILLGLQNPLGKEVVKNLGANDEENLQIIGVVKDFNFESFREEIKPLAFQYFRPHFLSDYIAVRFEEGANLMEEVNRVEEAWSEFQEEDPFVYSFLDQDFDRQFKAEKRFGSILGLFSLLAIVIACLGLLGLSSYTLQQKQKEIGIRKVLGASLFQVIILLSSYYTKLIIIAFCITVPVSFYLINLWLSDFAYRIEVHFSYFIIGGIMTLGVAWLTVGFHCLKAGLMNPVNAIKSD